MTVGMLLNNISGYELTEWIAFAKLEQEDQGDSETSPEDNLNAMLKTMPDTVNQKSKFDMMQKNKVKIIKNAKKDKKGK